MDLWHSSKQYCCFCHCFLQNMSGLGMLACNIDTDLSYGITMLFIRTGTSKSQKSPIIKKKAYLLFSKFKIGNCEFRLVSVYIFECRNSWYQFQTKVELSLIFPSYPRLTSGISIANVFHTYTEARSIFFGFFANTKIFEVEWLVISYCLFFSFKSFLLKNKRNCLC